MIVGVLALQGGFAEHVHALQSIGVSSIEIRTIKDLSQGIHALIIPGGESTVIGRLLHETGLFSPIHTMIQEGLPVWGTCAGMILLSTQKESDFPKYFESIPITVKRNGFGRQLGSFTIKETFYGIGSIPMTFIRAPYISDADKDVHILATVQNVAVAAQYRNILVTAFHPELTSDVQVLRYFLQNVSNR